MMGTGVYYETMFITLPVRRTLNYNEIEESTLNLKATYSLNFIACLTITYTIKGKNVGVGPNVVG